MNRLAALRAILAMGALLIGTEVSLAAPDAERDLISPRVRELVQQDGHARVIVELKLSAGAPSSEGSVSPATASVQRGDIASTGARVLGRLQGMSHRVRHRYLTVPFLALQVGPDALAALETSGADVARVAIDALHVPTLSESVPLVQADQAWAEGLDGTGMVVAVIDTGVESTHPFLAAKVVEEACFSTTVAGRSGSLCPDGSDDQVGPGAAASCALEGCWHGTHVAGIAAGNGAPAGEPFSGVARGAQIMAVQVFSRFDRFQDCGGFLPPCLSAYTSDVIAGLERVYLLREQYRLAAVNLSLGGGSFASPCDAEPFKPIIDNLRSVGIATIAASGNNGFADSLSSPGCISSAVSVASTSKSDIVSDFSNVAPFLSLFAPGEAILSSVTGGDFAWASGTSMAAPHVSGAWAVLKQAAPEATVDAILAALEQTGVPITDPRNGVVRPRIQIADALAQLQPDVPRVSGVSPDHGTIGTTLALTVTGRNFQVGATLSFGGGGITVNSTTVNSATELAASITIAAGAVLGPRDVTVSNPGGQTGTRAAGFAVAAPPPTLALAFSGKLRDRVGQGNTALAPDGALDGTFAVTVQPGSGARVITELELRRGDGGGIWDTVAATSYWVLGAAGSLDGALLNSPSGAVSFPVGDGSGFVLYAADPSGSLFAAGATFTVTARFADFSVATASTVVAAAPTITDVAPAQGTAGTTVQVTITGTNFQNGATVTAGSAIAVGAVTVASATQITASFAIAPSAAPGPRDVTVTNPGGMNATKTAGFAVASPPPSLALGFSGKLRDRVGQGNTALAADGSLDAAFTVTVQAGSGPRSVTQLELRRSDGGGIWDTVSATGYWALGAAASLDAPLLNSSTAAVTFAVADGGSFLIFAADTTSNLFSAGTSFMLTARFADGSSATASTALGPQLTIGAVTPSQGTVGTAMDVTIAGTNFQSGATASFGPGIAVTTTVNSSTQLTARLSIASSATPGPRDVTVSNPTGPGAVRRGGFTVVPPPPTLALAYAGKLRDRVGQGSTSLAPDGALDGTFSVVLGAGSGTRTFTQLELRRSDGGGIWDTVSATSYWVLGAAAGLDTPLLNSSTAAVGFPAAEGTSVALFASDWGAGLFASGTTFVLTARFADGSTASASTTLGPQLTISTIVPSQGTAGTTLDVTVTGTSFQPGATVSFGPGSTVTTTVISDIQLTARLAIAPTATPGPRDVTVTNPGGSSATRLGGFSVTPPPPTLALSYAGKLRDRVGRGSTTLVPDGALDGTFSVILVAGSGTRTITQLELRRSDGGGVWDTVSWTGFWALGAAAALDTPLLNSSIAAVSFAVADGGSFVLFAADWGAGLFAPGTTFALTARFADGSTATATAGIGP